MNCCNTGVLSFLLLLPASLSLAEEQGARLINELDRRVEILLKEASFGEAKLPLSDAPLPLEANSNVLMPGDISSVSYAIETSAGKRHFNLVRGKEEKQLVVKITEYDLPAKRPAMPLVTFDKPEEFHEFLNGLAELARGEKGTASNQWFAGWALHFRGRYKEALPYLLAASDAGNEDAHAMLGRMYIYGQGTGRDKEKGLHYLDLAVRSGAARGIYWRGVLHHKGIAVRQDKARSVKLLKQAHEMKFPPATALLGHLMFTGDGIEKQMLAGWLLMKTAAEEPIDFETRGLTQLRVGLAYQQQEMGFTNGEQSLKYLKMAAKAGQPEAHLFLGTLYARGHKSGAGNDALSKDIFGPDIPPNRELAIRHLTEARRLGIPGSAEMLASAKKMPKEKTAAEIKGEQLGDAVIAVLDAIVNSKPHRPAGSSGGSASGYSGSSLPWIGPKYDPLWEPTCHSCLGTGRYLGNNCPKCGGSGSSDY